MVFRIILSEPKFDFCWRNRGIDISTFPRFWAIKCVDLNHTLGLVITHNIVKNAKSDGYQWQQSSMTHQIYKMNLNIRCKGTKNRWIKRGGSIDENLTGYLQRYGVPGYERKHFYFEYKQHGVSNNSQGAELWLSSQNGRNLAIKCEMSRSAWRVEVLSQEQPLFWAIGCLMMKSQILTIQVEWKNRQLFHFINRIWGYGREGVGNDTEILVSERTNVNCELLQILVNWICFV
jgi:hypothetical protein